MASLDLATNHLALEPVLLAKMKTVSGLAQTGGAYEFDTLLRQGGELPAAFALYGGDEETGIAGEFAQLWQVVIVAKPKLDEDSSSLSTLGRLISKFIEVLFGASWKPADNAQVPVRLYDSTEPVIYADGQVHVPISMRVVLRKARTQNDRWN